MFKHFFPEAAAISTDLTEARPLIRIELTVKTPDGGQLSFGLVNCPKDFERRYALQTRKSPSMTLIRLTTNGQCVTSPLVCDITFELARHEFQRTFGMSWLHCVG
jgi:hypothetical protein